MCHTESAKRQRRRIAVNAQDCCRSIRVLVCEGAPSCLPRCVSPRGHTLAHRRRSHDAYLHKLRTFSQRLGSERSYRGNGRAVLRVKPVVRAADQIVQKLFGIGPGKDAVHANP